MLLWLVLTLGLATAVASSSSDEDLAPNMAEKYRPRYTLMAVDSKNKDTDDKPAPEKGLGPQQQPWRRLSPYGHNSPTWPLNGLVPMPTSAILTPLLGPGLLLVGINLGALLYMLLSLLGLSPNRNLNDFYRRQGQLDGSGKESDIYL